MDIKFGKIKPKSNFFTQSASENEENNIFSDSSDFEIKEEVLQNYAGKRLNDYDSNLLENNAYQVLPDESFKLEHKINLLEESLKKINSEIATLDNFGYEIQIFDLRNRKQKIEEEIKTLNKKYSEINLSSKISGQISSAVSMASNSKNNVFTSFQTFISKNILAKVSKKFDSSLKMKEALNSLTNINLSVDELMQMQSPYGETLNRYEKLTAYLNKANLIHSQINLNMNDLTSKKKA
jgi:hypothetical protein